MTKQEIFRKIIEVDVYFFLNNTNNGFITEISQEPYSYVFEVRVEGETYYVKFEGESSSFYYVRIEGESSSLDGTKWTNAYIVQPAQKTVTTYEKVPNSDSILKIGASLENDLNAVLEHYVSENDTAYFNRLLYSDRGATRFRYTVVEDRNLGDGNACFATLYFSSVDKYVTLEGTYSSWDSSHWNKVYFSEPFTYQETRYKPKG